MKHNKTGHYEEISIRQHGPAIALLLLCALCGEPLLAPLPASAQTVIATGDADAAANVTNVVNVNITDSEGLISLLNLFEPYIGTIDLSNLQSGPQDCPSCVQQSIQTSSIIEDVNTSTIENDLEVTADTGNNTAQGDGTSTIVTGNAAAAGNVVNVVNTNIDDSNYLLFVLNNFSLLQGDVVLPGKDFFAQFLGGEGAGSGSSGESTPANVTNDNTSTIAEDIVADASTGGNAVGGDGGAATITTGDAMAVANSITMANTNITANNAMVLIVRVPGAWNGKIFSMPPGISWIATPDGLILTGSAASTLFSGSGTVSNTNSASVSNNVHVYALTGDNQASGEGSAIATGDASAAANTVNLVNTNVIGHNILFGLINIMGDWEGNLAFGRPDLWVGTQATVSEDPLGPNSTVDYTVTLANRGDADATDVVLRASDGMAGVATVTDAGGATTDDDGSLEWDLPVVPAGGQMQFHFAKRLLSTLPFVGKQSFTENVGATLYENDADPSDNSDSISFLADGPAFYQHISRLVLNESNSAQSGSIEPGNLVTYDFTVFDSRLGGPADNVRLSETLYDPYGNVMSTSSWPLGSLNTGDGVKVSYDAWFPENAPGGWYISSSSIEGVDSGGNIWRTKDLVASSSVYVMVHQTIATSSPVSQVIYVTAQASSSAVTSTVVKRPATITHIKPPKAPTSTATATVSEAATASSSGRPRTAFMADMAGALGDYPVRWFRALLGLQDWMPGRL